MANNPSPQTPSLSEGHPAVRQSVETAITEGLAWSDADHGPLPLSRPFRSSNPGHDIPSDMCTTPFSQTGNEGNLEPHEGFSPGTLPITVGMTKKSKTIVPPSLIRLRSLYGTWA
jgi:hypothetical protein